MFRNYIHLILLLSTLIYDFKNIYTQEVISSQGTVYFNSNGSISFTVGEAVISTLTGSNNDATQGFQQPHSLTTNLTDDYCGSDPSTAIEVANSEYFEIDEIYASNAIHMYEWKITNVTATPNVTIYGYTGPLGYGIYRHKMSLSDATDPSGNSSGTTRIEDVSGGSWSANYTPIPSGFLTTNTTYSVQIRAKLNSNGNGLVTSYGKICYIKTPTSLPTTKLESAYCGNSSSPVDIINFTDIFECDHVPNTHHYIFHFYDDAATPGTYTNPVKTVATKNNNWRREMSLSKAKLFTENKIYKVTVQAVISSGGGTTPEDTECYIESPGPPGYTVKLSPTYCGSNASNTIKVNNNTIMKPEIDPTISANSVWGYRYRFYNDAITPGTYDNLRLDRPYMVRCLDNNGGDDDACYKTGSSKDKICLYCSTSGVINARLAANTGDIFRVEVEARLFNSECSTPPCLVAMSSTSCYIEYDPNSTLPKSISLDINPIINIFPNPNDGSHFYINAYGFTDSEDDIIISIIDLHGKQVYLENTGITANQIIKELTFNNTLADGIYLIKLSKGPYSSIQKLIIH